MQIDINRFKKTFFEESVDHFAAMESGLLAMETGAADQEVINAVFRAVHSMKGSAAAFEFHDLAGFAHVVESLLDELRSGAAPATERAMELLLQSVDMLRALVDDAAKLGSAGYAPAADPLQVAALAKSLKQTIGQGQEAAGAVEQTAEAAESAPPSNDAHVHETNVCDLPANHPQDGAVSHAVDQFRPEAPQQKMPVEQFARPEPAAVASPALLRWQIRFLPSRDIFRCGMDPILILRDLARQGTLCNLVAIRDSVPSLAELDPSECHLGWEFVLESAAPKSEILEAFAFVEDESVIAVEPLPASPASTEGHVQRPLSPQDGGSERAPFQPGLPGQSGLPCQAGQSSSSAPMPAEGSHAARPAARRGEGESAPARSLQPVGTREESIRVATHKVDKLIDLVGELVISQSMASSILTGFTAPELEPLRAAMAQLERFSRELQDTVLSVRMLPVGGIFGRLPRMVRDLALTLGKQIELRLSGEETELDKSVVERLGDPLTHLVRNAVDHGIERPEERLKAGKPERGVIEVAAYHEAGNVYVEVRDDGRGLDLERIRQKAIANGLLREGDERNPEQLRHLIFHAGLSTAERVSDVSGRGVGMDVVKRNVEALNGSVLVSSREGGGTTIRVKLPLTLAILDGQCLRVGGETYILPLVSIIESIRPLREQVCAVAGQGELVMLRGEPVRLLRLHVLFGVEGETDPSRGLVVIVEHEGQRLALLVDELDAQIQVVVKSLETNFRKVEGFAGATILGNGRAALILDVAGIAAMSARDSIPRPRPAHAA